MSKRPMADFLKILSDSGVPVTENALEEKLRQEVIGAGSEVSNDSKMSPFWRWVSAAVIKPVVWLVEVLLATHVMPNMFVGTAKRWALELKAWELDVTPKGAEKTQGLITFIKANSNDSVTLPEGSIIQTLPIDGVAYQVKLLAETVMDAGKPSAKVLVEALEAGAAYNLPAGYFNILPEALPGIVSAVNEPDWITHLGANAETDEELALRLQNAFTSSGEWHIDDAYRSIISNVAGIRSDNVYFHNTGHISPGTAEALIVMEVGPTPQTILDKLNNKITDEGYHGHGDVMTCKAIPDSKQDVITDVMLVANLDDQKKVDELAEVENRIRAAFRENAGYPEMTRAKPNSRFSLSLLGGEIHTSMANIESVKFMVGEKVQEDIVSGLEQPRLNSLVVRELANG